MKSNIIGRKAEIEKLERIADSDRSEFVAIYGRRRVGKTFLVKELFEDRFVFRITGKEQTDTKGQLRNFSASLRSFFGDAEDSQNWDMAFKQLANYIEGIVTPGAKLIFFDELPWMDTWGSDFLSSFEHFWNDWANYRDDIKLIVCGSATTWMLDKVINSRGGLHNRVTHSILLSPFTLHESEKFFMSRGFRYGRQEILECYMAVGGVAYYLSLFDPGESVAQNIERLCFSRGGELRDEFNRVFRSLFRSPDKYIEIVEALHKKARGMTRTEIIELTKLINNGNLSRMMSELEACDFIRSYTPFGKSNKDTMYQLIDPFLLFHFKFIQNQPVPLGGYWLKLINTPQYSNWCGYAFEVVCLNHIEQIVKALGIDGMINTPCSWTYRPPKRLAETDETDEDLLHGTQIDLLINRSDNVINLCEMKYSRSSYEITRQYNEQMERRMRLFAKVSRTKKTLMPVYITPFGLYDNMYSRRMTRTVTGDDLFAF